jgi:hypothetical protein
VGNREKGRNNVRWGLAWRISRKWHKIWLMGRLIYLIRHTEYDSWGEGGRMDFVLVVMCELPNLDYFPFQCIGSPRNSSKTLMNCHTGPVPGSYVKASTGFGNMETCSNCHSCPSIFLSDVTTVLLKKVIYVEYERCYLMYTLH